MRHDTAGSTSTSTRLHFLTMPVLYLALSLAIVSRTVLHLNTSFIGGPGDPQQFIWYLGWFWHAVVTGQNPFLTWCLNYPVGQNLMWNTSIFAQAVVFGWLSFLFNGTFLYNLLWLLNFVASCVLGARLLTTLRMRPSLAVFGGALFGILPYSTSQSLFHMHLWFTSATIAIIYLLVRATLRVPRYPVLYGALVGLLIGFQFYSSLEVFTTMAFALVVMAVIAVCVLQRSVAAYRPRLTWRGWCTAGLTALVVTAPGLCVLFFGSNRPHGALLPPDVYVNDLLNFVVPTRVFLLHGSYTDALSSWYTGNFWENNAYLGLPVIALLAWAACVLRRQRAALAAFLFVVVVSLCSLGPHLHVRGRVTSIPLPWAIALHVPFLDSAIPSRLMFYADMLVVVLILYAVEMTLRGQVSRESRFTVVLWLCTMLLSWLPEMPYYTTATPACAAGLAATSPVYTAVKGQPTYVLTRDPSVAMQAIAEHGYLFPMVNPYGYTNNDLAREQQLKRLDAIAALRLSGLPAQYVMKTALPALHATRLLYFPSSSDRANSEQIVHLVSGALGPPIAQSAGLVVWRVPPR